MQLERRNQSNLPPPPKVSSLCASQIETSPDRQERPREAPPPTEQTLGLSQQFAMGLPRASVAGFEVIASHRLEPSEISEAFRFFLLFFVAKSVLRNSVQGTQK